MRVIIIDDEPLALRILSQQFHVMGFHDVHTFDSVANAMNLILTEKNSIDLILTDLQMPEIDGVELMRLLAGLSYKGGVALISGEDPRLVNSVGKLVSAQNLNILGIFNKPISNYLVEKLVENISTKKSQKTHRPSKSITDPHDLKRGIINDEMIVYYQPQVNLSNGDLVGVESLVRWKHPVLGMLMPDQFIPLAEDFSMIDMLTHSVVRSSLSASRIWKSMDLKIPVSVNVSMNNLYSLEFPDMIQDALNAHQSQSLDLLLEITESKLISDIIKPLDVLTRLRLKRIKLSIDDFGTGHSSLVQLRDLPFNELKIDRSFVHGAHHDNSLRTILESSLNMAHKLGMTTVAEGVEDEQDWDFMRSTGCDVAQGWFIAKAMPESDIPAWLRSWNERTRSLFGGES